MLETKHYDAIVIGSGQGGNPLARALAGAGRSTALVEREHVGGTCVNVGCTPTKTMVASARVAYLARRAADYGVHTGSVSVHMDEVRARKRAIVASFRSGSERRIEGTKGLDLIRGAARFASPLAIDVQRGDETHSISASAIFINTGARPAKPQLPGLDEVRTLDSTSIMELDAVPEHLLILGGGYIGLEFGQMFRRFGSRVTIVQRSRQLLPREDPDVAEAIAAILREDGIEVLLNAVATQVEQTAPGGKDPRLVVKTPEGERTVQGSHLLVATGRTPNTEDLNLPAAGVQTDERGYVRVNERLETNVPGIYALGDVKAGPAFTHISYDDYRILKANLLEGKAATTTGRMVPYTVFMDPQLGRVGLTEQEARALGRPIRVAKMPMSHVARALELDEARGFMKVVIDAESAQILGCAILGIEGGEIMSALQIAMMGRVPYTALRDATFAHPTLAESLNNLFM
ncbi:MAG TPA: mercuric reductase [Isosphaeraceae bacterium]|jgi:pyruvate/2-oxoglutarate dehydrogenase complex dihydrolipoamide dehydrogenase (E3) component|nr:mercuric reductase [Isosphaeraceae bacterium]